MSDDERIAALSGIGGTGLMTPTVIEELRASARGARALKKLGIRGRLGSFGGVGTYMGAASLPLIIYLLRK